MQHGGKERLNSSVNWSETSIINDFRIFLEILFGSTAFSGLWDIMSFLISIASVGLWRKLTVLGGERKS